MATLKFELPDKLWKVTKIYSTVGVRQEHLKIVESFSKEYFFKDVNLANEFYSQFNWEYKEFVPVGIEGTDEVGYELGVIMKIQKIDTIELIPEIIDL